MVKGVKIVIEEDKYIELQKELEYYKTLYKGSQKYVGIKPWINTPLTDNT